MITILPSHAGLTAIEGGRFTFYLTPNETLTAALQIRWEIVAPDGEAVSAGLFGETAGTIDFANGADTHQPLHIDIIDNNDIDDLHSTYEVVFYQVADTANTDDEEIARESVMVLDNDSTLDITVDRAENLFYGDSQNNETITTGNGNDSIVGGSGDDTISAGRGTDEIYLDSDEDAASTGGADKVRYAIGVTGGGAAGGTADSGTSYIAFDGADSIFGFKRGEDSIIFTLPASTSGENDALADMFLSDINDEYVVRPFVDLKEDAPLNGAINDTYEITALSFSFKQTVYLPHGRISSPVLLVYFDEALSIDGFYAAITIDGVMHLDTTRGTLNSAAGVRGILGENGIVVEKELPTPDITTSEITLTDIVLSLDEDNVLPLAAELPEALSSELPENATLILTGLPTTGHLFVISDGNPPRPLNDTDVAGAGLEVDFTNESLLYTPAPDYFGTASFFVRAEDAAGLITNEVRVIFDVANVLDAPSILNHTDASYNFFDALVFTAVAGGESGNDTRFEFRPDGDTLAISAGTGDNSFTLTGALGATLDQYIALINNAELSSGVVRASLARPELGNMVLLSQSSIFSVFTQSGSADRMPESSYEIVLNGGITETIMLNGTEDTNRVLTADDLQIFDADGADDIWGIRLLSVPDATQGFFYTGPNYVRSSAITADDLGANGVALSFARGVSFHPADNFNGAIRFSFRAIDQAGMESPHNAFAEIEIASRNDVPGAGGTIDGGASGGATGGGATGGAVTVNGQNRYALNVHDLGISDADGLDDITTVVVEAMFGIEAVELNYIDTTTTQLSLGDIIAGRVHLRFPADAAQDQALFHFHVIDSAGAQSPSAILRINILPIIYDIHGSDTQADTLTPTTASEDYTRIAGLGEDDNIDLSNAMGVNEIIYRIHSDRGDSHDGHYDGYDGSDVISNFSRGRDILSFADVASNPINTSDFMSYARANAVQISLFVSGNGRIVEGIRFFFAQSEHMIDDSDLRIMFSTNSQFVIENINGLADALDGTYRLQGLDMLPEIFSNNTWRVIAADSIDFSFTARAPNTSPEAADISLSMNKSFSASQHLRNEDALVLATSDFAISDADGNSQLRGIQITGDTENGDFFLHNVRLASGSVVLLSDIDAGALTFLPVVGYNGTVNFQYRAIDAASATSPYAALDIAVSTQGTVFYDDLDNIVQTEAFSAASVGFDDLGRYHTAPVSSVGDTVHIALLAGDDTLDLANSQGRDFIHYRVHSTVIGERYIFDGVDGSDIIENFHGDLDGIILNDIAINAVSASNFLNDTADTNLIITLPFAAGSDHLVDRIIFNFTADGPSGTAGSVLEIRFAADAFIDLNRSHLTVVKEHLALTTDNTLEDFSYLSTRLFPNQRFNFSDPHLAPTDILVDLAEQLLAPIAADDNATPIAATSTIAVLHTGSVVMRLSDLMISDPDGFADLSYIVLSGISEAGIVLNGTSYTDKDGQGLVVTLDEIRNGNLTINLNAQGDTSLSYILYDQANATANSAMAIYQLHTFGGDYLGSGAPDTITVPDTAVLSGEEARVINHVGGGYGIDTISLSNGIDEIYYRINSQDAGLIALDGSDEVSDQVSETTFELGRDVLVFVDTNPAALSKSAFYARASEANWVVNLETDNVGAGGAQLQLNAIEFVMPQAAGSLARYTIGLNNMVLSSEFSATLRAQLQNGQLQDFALLERIFGANNIKVIALAEVPFDFDSFTPAVPLLAADSIYSIEKTESYSFTGQEFIKSELDIATHHTDIVIEIAEISGSGTFTMQGATELLLTAGTRLSAGDTVNNQLNYTPAADFTGIASLIYRLHEPNGQRTSYGEVQIIVEDAPSIITGTAQLDDFTPITSTRFQVTHIMSLENAAPNTPADEVIDITASLGRDVLYFTFSASSTDTGAPDFIGTDASNPDAADISGSDTILGFERGRDQLVLLKEGGTADFLTQGLDNNVVITLEQTDNLYSALHIVFARDPDTLADDTTLTIRFTQNSWFAATDIVNMGENLLTASDTSARLQDFAFLPAIFAHDFENMEGLRTLTTSDHFLSTQSAPTDLAIGLNLPYSLTASDFGFTAASYTPAQRTDVLLNITPPLPEQGALHLHGSPLAARFITLGDLLDGALTFVPNAIFSGDVVLDYGQYSAQEDIYAPRQTVSIEFLPYVGPVPEGARLVLETDTAHNFTPSDFGFDITMMDASQIAQAFVALENASSASAGGIFTLNGTPLADIAGEQIMLSDIINGAFVYTPNASGVVDLDFRLGSRGGALSDGLGQIDFHVETHLPSQAGSDGLDTQIITSTTGDTTYIHSGTNDNADSSDIGVNIDNYDLNNSQGRDHFYFRFGSRDAPHDFYEPLDASNSALPRIESTDRLHGGTDLITGFELGRDVLIFADVDDTPIDLATFMANAEDNDVTINTLANNDTVVGVQFFFAANNSSPAGYSILQVFFSEDTSPLTSAVDVNDPLSFFVNDNLERATLRVEAASESFYPVFGGAPTYVNPQTPIGTDATDGDITIASGDHFDESHTITGANTLPVGSLVNWFENVETVNLNDSLGQDNVYFRFESNTTNSGHYELIDTRNLDNIVGLHAGTTTGNGQIRVIYEGGVDVVSGFERGHDTLIFADVNATPVDLTTFLNNNGVKVFIDFESDTYVISGLMFEFAAADIAMGDGRVNVSFTDAPSPNSGATLYDYSGLIDAIGGEINGQTEEVAFRLLDTSYVSTILGDGSLRVEAASETLTPLFGELAPPPPRLVKGSDGTDADIVIGNSSLAQGYSHISHVTTGTNTQSLGSPSSGFDNLETINLDNVLGQDNVYFRFESNTTNSGNYELTDTRDLGAPLGSHDATTTPDGQNRLTYAGGRDVVNGFERGHDTLIFADISGTAVNLDDFLSADAVSVIIEIDFTDLTIEGLTFQLAATDAAASYGRVSVFFAADDVALDDFSGLIDTINSVTNGGTQVTERYLLDTSYVTDIIGEGSLRVEDDSANFNTLFDII